MLHRVIVFGLVLCCSAASSRAESIIERLEALESRVALLERQIVASPQPCSSLGEGWKRYEAASGRFLLGDNGDGETSEAGGSPEITIGLSNLPKHSHRVANLRRAYDETEGRVDGFQPGHAFSDGANPGRVWVGGTPLAGNYVVTEEEGSSTPLKHMPPFQEIYFCTKASQN